MSENEQQLHVRSPLIQSLSLAKYANANVYLKLENTQPSGSFKIRGIGNFMKKVCLCLYAIKTKFLLFKIFLNVFAY